VASQESRESESKEDEMGAVRVATIVVSGDQHQQPSTYPSLIPIDNIPSAAKKTPIQMAVMMTTSFVLLGSS